jgi:phospholipase/carboxylesterase
MHDGTIVVQRPAVPRQLVLLFHGVGSSAANLLPVAEAIAGCDPDAMVVSVDASHPSTLGSGREWFSVVGITEENRPGRIAAAIPSFQESIGHWQGVSGLAAGATTLVGFSQGAILSLEVTQMEGPPVAGRVVAIAGRFAVPVRHAPEHVRFHFVHGDADPVVPARYSVNAAEALSAAGASVTLDVVPGLGHGIDARVIQLLQRYLASS